MPNLIAHFLRAVLAIFIALYAIGFALLCVGMIARCVYLVAKAFCKRGLKAFRVSTAGNTFNDIA